MGIINCLDENNNRLLSELEKEYQIEFRAENVDYYSVFTQNKTAIISYNPQNKIEDESIMHELLHIWLIQFKCLSGNHIYLSCLNHKKLKLVFIKFLTDYIGSCFDHYKMYPKFIEMGYAPEKFLSCGVAEKCTIKDIKNLKMRVLLAYSAKSVEKYIGYLISIYADHIDNNYTEHLRLLKQKNAELFEIVTNFWNKWKVFDIQNIDPIENSDFDLFESFISDMENWVERKIII